MTSGPSFQLFVNTHDSSTQPASIHLLVVPGISLALGIRHPVGIPAGATSVQRIPTQESLNDANRRHHQEKDRGQDYSCRDKRERFGQHHPRFVR